MFYTSPSKVSCFDYKTNTFMVNEKSHDLPPTLLPPQVILPKFTTQGALPPLHLGKPSACPLPGRDALTEHAIMCVELPADQRTLQAASRSPSLHHCTAQLPSLKTKGFQSLQPMCLGSP